MTPPGGSQGGSNTRWPEGPDRVAAELRRALDEASLRGPDDVTLRRGWSALATPTTEPRARSGFWFAGGVATTAALALVSAFWLWPHAVELAQSGGRARAIAKNDGKTDGKTDGTMMSGARRLTLEGGVEAVLGRSCVMRLEDGAPRVEGGEVRFSVPHRQPGHPFVVRAEGYRVVVVGTRFGVSVDAQAVGVDVDEGIVEVWETANDHQTDRRVARLTPGERWQSPPDARPSDARPSPAPVVVPPILPLPAASAEPAHAHAHFRMGKHVRTVALASPGETGVAAERPTTGGASDAPDGEAAAARSALASGDAPRALQIYRALAQGTGPTAENAAYEVGKVLAEKLNQPAAAVSAWRHYRSAYPDGNLRLEADVSIIETLARTGDGDEALGEAVDFLRRHPDSERRAELARLAGDLYRTRGDCRRAVAVYQIAVGASRPHDAVEAATFQRAACLVRLGDAGGSDAVRAYLKAYPNGKFRGDAAALSNDGARP